MKMQSKTRRKAAFTLYELVVVMAISLIVVGLVTSYIIFAEKFNQRSKEAFERVEQFAALRKEIDDWFSFADSSQFDIALNDGTNDELPLVYLQDALGNVAKNAEGKCYGISLAQGQTAGLVFNFPPCEGVSRGEGTVFCKYLSSVRFSLFDAGSEIAADEASVLRFTVCTTIKQGVYACEFLY
ncbi:MAG: type II secretion system protein [Candidatus Fimimonas sp.]